MKFLRENSYSQLETLEENTSKGKILYIEGPFLMSEAVNLNKRVYPRGVMEEAVDRYQREFIEQRRALGELNHPTYPMADPKKAAIKIESLKWQGNNVIGKARVLNTPDGDIIRALLDADFNLGVSSRGLGEVKESNGVGTITKFLLNAIDAVDMPSGQVCYVNAVNESLNWVEKNGVWVSESIETIIKKPSADEFMAGFEKLMHGIKNRK